jgi:hypothetical protein
VAIFKQVLCHTSMFGLSTYGNCGDPVTFNVGQPEFLEVTKKTLAKKWKPILPIFSFLNLMIDRRLL